MSSLSASISAKRSRPMSVCRDNRATFAVQQWRRRRQLIPLLCAFVIHHEARQIPTQDRPNPGRALRGLLIAALERAVAYLKVVSPDSSGTWPNPR